jgi:hypothetical protein
LETIVRTDYSYLMLMVRAQTKKVHEATLKGDWVLAGREMEELLKWGIEALVEFRKWEDRDR